MPIARPPRPAVIVAAPKYAAGADDPFEPGARMGRKLLSLAARAGYPPASWFARVFIPGAWVGDRPNDVVLAQRAAEIAREFPGRDVVCVGRDVAGAFGVTRDVPMLTWWPSWVLGPDRLAAVLPDPATGLTGKDIQGAARAFLAVLWDAPPPEKQDL